MTSGFAKSDVGCLRQLNEDTVALVRTTNARDKVDQTLAIVADGMGGHQAGDVASRLACEIVQSEGLDLASRLLHANEEILNAGIENPTFRGMGCTCTALLARGRKATIAHIGDSRAYLFRQGILTQLTVDDTLENLLNGEEEISLMNAKHILTKALGMEGLQEIQCIRLKLRADDRLLLCSDGLYNELSTEDIIELLAPTHDPQSVVEQLITSALANGGSDNISAIVLHVTQENK